MGAFIIIDIEFATGEDRFKFESWKNLKYQDRLVDEKSDSAGFAAWRMMRTPELNPIYNMGFMGYEEPKEILKEAKKKGIKIKSLNWIPINDKESTWRKEK
jgi:hypothetical protein